MSAAASLLSELRGRGLHVARAGDRIRYRGPSGAMTADLAAAVHAERVDLLALLDRDERAAWRARFELRVAELRHVGGWWRAPVPSSSWPSIGRLRIPKWTRCRARRPSRSRSPHSKRSGSLAPSPATFRAASSRERA